uniref:Putative ovule protein n=1 Tax=Solanum chacoense TaxID=4108 RepID=A0A0V0GQY2_SOLCH
MKAYLSEVPIYRQYFFAAFGISLLFLLSPFRRCRGDGRTVVGLPSTTQYLSKSNSITSHIN